jgi:hypothetical protein
LGLRFWNWRDGGASRGDRYGGGRGWISGSVKWKWISKARCVCFKAVRDGESNVARDCDDVGESGAPGRAIDQRSDRSSKSAKRYLKKRKCDDANAFFNDDHRNTFTWCSPERYLAPRSAVRLCRPNVFFRNEGWHLLLSDRTPLRRRSYRRDQNQQPPRCFLCCSDDFLLPLSLLRLVAPSHD